MIKHLIAIALIAMALLAACAGDTTAPSSPPPSPRITELPAVNWRTSTPETHTYHFQPSAYVCRCDPTATPPPEPGPAVYDCDGQLAPTAWLTATFGAVTWQNGDGGAALTALRAACDPGESRSESGVDAPAVLVAHVDGADGDPGESRSDSGAGRPLEGVTVVLSWPDAPMLPAEMRTCGIDRGIYGPTNQAGDIGFGLGRGAYYSPPDGGPHSLFIPGGDCVRGLGMLAATNHHHLDTGWTLPLPAGWRESGGHPLGGAPTLDVALRDWGYTPGSLVYPEPVNGRPMQVIRWPEAP